MSESPYPPYGGEPQQPAGQQPPYGQPHSGQNPYGVPYGYAPQEHPQATTVLILGILGLVLCQVLSPFAWVMGNRVVREIDGSQGRTGGRSSANAGRICGIIGTVLLGCSLLIVVFIVIVAVASASTAP